jgi:hypothetical protein
LKNAECLLVFAKRLFLEITLFEIVTLIDINTDMPDQEKLTKREGSIQFTSSLG